MIKAKLKKCNNCGRETFIWSNGNCKYCSTKEKIKTKKHSNFFKKIYNKYENMPSLSFVSKKEIKELNNYNFAHIFPKERYKSISEFEDNILILTLEEHTEFDRLLNNFDFEGLKLFFGDSWEHFLYRVAALLPFVEEQGNLKTELTNLINKPS